MIQIYSIIIILLVIGTLFFDNKSAKGRVFFCFVVAFIGIITGLRSENVGHDTANYLVIYDIVSSTPFMQIFTTPPYNVLEPGFLILCWFCGYLGLESYMFVLLISLICFTCIGFWIWQNSYSPMFSLLIFFCMFYTFYLTGIRQCIALSIVLLSYRAISESKWKWLLFYVFLGFLFHRTALIFILMYFISKIKNTNKALLFVLLLFPIVYSFRSGIFPLLTLFSDRFEHYVILNHGDATNYTILLALVCVAAYFCSKSTSTISDDYRRYHACLMLSFLIMPFVGLNGSIMRVAMYFTMAICFLIPQAIKIFPDKAISMVAKVVTICVLLLLVSTTLLSSETYRYELNPYIKFN